MNRRGQTSIELLLLLAVSMLALTLIYSLYYSQVDSVSQSSDSSVAKNSIQTLVNTANSLYYSGAGSKEEILIEIPASASLEESSISNNTISIRLANGTDVVGTADVNFSGAWKTFGEEYVLGKYLVYLYYDGNVVNIYYNDFDLSVDSFYISANQGSTIQKTLSVRNSSDTSSRIWVTSSFSHSPNAILSIASEDIYFTLSSGETRLVDFNVVLLESATGNFVGTLNVMGEIDDGQGDYNKEKKVTVSVESFLSPLIVAIYPKTTTFSAVRTTPYTKDFSVCNLSASDFVSVSWAKAGEGSDSNNASTWFTIPAITSPPALSCTNFSLVITPPSGVTIGEHDANISITADSNVFTANLIINVTS